MKLPTRPFIRKSCRSDRCQRPADSSASKFAAQTIRKIYEIGWKPTHIVSSVSSSVGLVMRPAGPEKSVGVISATYGKDPTDPQWQDTREYNEWLAWMKKYNTSGNLADADTVYGYSAAQTMVAVLKACGDNLTRENLMKRAASVHGLQLPMLLPGIIISTDANDFAPIKQMQLQNSTEPYGSYFLTWSRDSTYKHMKP